MIGLVVLWLIGLGACLVGWVLVLFWLGRVWVIVVGVLGVVCLNHLSALIVSPDSIFSHNLIIADVHLMFISCKSYFPVFNICLINLTGSKWNDIMSVLIMI